MADAVQLPFVDEPAERVELGVFRKQILPIGEVVTDKYEPGVLKFDRPRLQAIIERFKAGAYDMVPFLLADRDGGHHDDPERIRGEVRDLELTDEGLFAKIKTSEAGSRLLRESPRLPVSVRLVPDKDGEALGHVLATPEPVWKGQREWELIEASAGRPVIDLSDSAFTVRDTEHGSSVAEDTATFTKEDSELLAKLRERIAAAPSDDDKSDEQKMDELLNALLADENPSDENPDEEPDETADEEPVVTGASMSAEDRAALEMAKRKTEQSEKRIAELEKKLAKERFGREKDELLQQGVPPMLVELAQPVLTAPRIEPIELAGGKKVDPQETVRKMLHAAKGLIEFGERGNGATGDLDEDREAAQELAGRLKERFGG